jgi:D-threo-aldose 1-dehydrogenase
MTGSALIDQPGLGSDWLRTLGATGLTVSAVCAGGAPLGSMPENFGYEVPEGQGVDVVRAVLDSPIRFIDTANGYSDGESERRIGSALAEVGGPPADFVVATKVDAKAGDYSGSRVRQSVRESKERLGLDVLPMVYLHDPEFHDFADLAAPDGAVRTLAKLRDEGEVLHIGLAGGDVHQMARYLGLGVFEALLIHNRWTLVDRSALELLSVAHESGIAVVNAAIYGGGILANPHGGLANYGYRPATPATLVAIAAMDAACARWGTDLPTAALQASLRDPLITSTVVGFSKPERVAKILDAVRADLPDELFAELSELMPARENWLDFHN